MAEIKSVTLKFKCNQNWDTMPQVPGGRFCDVCSKKVIDFSNKTQAEFNRAFIETEGKLCGAFTAETEVKILGDNVRRWRNAAIVAGAASLVFAGCKTKGTGIIMGGIVNYPTQQYILETAYEINARNLGISKRLDSLMRVSLPTFNGEFDKAPGFISKYQAPWHPYPYSAILLHFQEETRLPKKLQYQGAFTLNVTINSKGRVDNIVFDKELPKTVQRKVIAAGKKLRFSPAIKDGKALPFTLTVPLSIYKEQMQEGNPAPK